MTTRLAQSHWTRPSVRPRSNASARYCSRIVASSSENARQTCLQVPRHFVWNLCKHRLKVNTGTQVALVRMRSSAVAEPVSDEAVPDEDAVTIRSSLLHSLPFELGRDHIDFGGPDQNVPPTLGIERVIVVEIKKDER